MTPAIEPDTEAAVRRALVDRAEAVVCDPTPFDEVVGAAIARQGGGGQAGPHALTATAVNGALATRAADVAVTPTPFAQVVAAAAGRRDGIGPQPADAPGSPGGSGGPPRHPPDPPPGAGSGPARGARPLLLALGALAVIAVVAIAGFLVLAADDDGEPVATGCGSGSTAGARSTICTTTSAASTTRSSTTTSTPATTTTTSSTSTTTTTSTTLVERSTRALEVVFEGEGIVTVDGETLEYRDEPQSVLLDEYDSIRFVEFDGGIPDLLVALADFASFESELLPIGLAGVIVDLDPVPPDTSLVLVVSSGERDREEVGSDCVVFDATGYEICLDRP